MIKRICSLIIVVVFVLTTVQVFSAVQTARKTAVAAYGTPIVDGKIDDVWDKTEYNLINVVRGNNNYEYYKGWFKLLWDENNMYVLAKVYSEQFSTVDPSPWNNDSFEVFFDENMGRTTTYQADDFQLRVECDGDISGTNYDLTKVKSGVTRFDNGYTAEMSFPLKTVSPKDGLTMGFDIQVNASATLAFAKTLYGWNALKGNSSVNTSDHGDVILKKSISPSNFDEPEYIKRTYSGEFNGVDKADEYEYFTDVTSMFDSTPHNFPILHINDYPCMSIGNLATFIGGAAEGNTLIKDNYRLTYTEGSRLAKDANGHIMLERRPKMWNGELYVPISSLMPTLGYHMEYNRFDKLLELQTGTDYPDSEVIVYARDYGAVGDGKTDDKDALIRAFNAAIGSGKPSILVLDENKTYVVSEKQDSMALFELRNINNFTFEGNGSTILFKTPTNTFTYVRECTNVKFKNVHIDYIEHMTTQGRITAIDVENGTFQMEIEGPVPLPADDDWAQYHGASAQGGVWWFGQLMDSVEDRLKFTYKDHYFLDSIKLVRDRVYEVKVRADQASGLVYAEIGDRFTVKNRMAAYDVNTALKQDTVTSFIRVWYSKDVVFEGVTNTASPQFFADVGLCTGRIIFRKCGMLLKEGTLTNGCADGISYWRNRAGVIMEGCTFMNNLDDHINTKTVSAVAKNKVDDYTYDIDYDINIRVGDEIALFDGLKYEIIETAYVTAYERRGSEDATITLDRKVAGLQTKNESNPTLIYNVSASGKGSIVRNNTYINGRRHAYISRSANSIFEGNKVMNNGGCMLAAMNEFSTKWRNEGFFPSAFTMRNNVVDSDGMTHGYYPVEIKSWESSLGDQAAIDGFLIENNVIDVPSLLGGMYINSVTDLYMFNNTLVCDKPLNEQTRPISITNSSIAVIDGLTLDYKQNVNAVVSIAGCKVDEDNIKNITILGENSAKPYIIE